MQAKKQLALLSSSIIKKIIYLELLTSFLSEPCKQRRELASQSSYIVDKESLARIVN